MLKDNPDISHLTMAHVMYESQKIIETDTIAVKKLETMRNNTTLQFIATKDEAYIGVIELHDLLKEGIN